MRFLFLFLCLLSLAPTAGADTATSPFTVIDLGAIRAATHAPGALALNDRGQVVGGFGHAFLWDNGRKTDLGVLPREGIEDFAYSVAWGINSRGQIVGSSGSFGPVVMSGLEFARGILYENGGLRQLTQRNASFEPYAINDQGLIIGLDGYRGFLYENGRLTQIGTLSGAPAGNRSTARALNRRGQVVGWSTVNSRLRVKRGELPTHAFLWQRGGKSGRMRDLGTLPGCVNSAASGINRRGEIAGTAADAAGKSRAFRWCRGRMTGLGALPGGHDSEAFGINDAGAVVGKSDDRAFLWESGRMRDLNALIPAGSGWALAEARAINAKGQIAGNGTLGGQPHAFLLTPYRDGAGK